MVKRNRCFIAAYLVCIGVWPAAAEDRIEVESVLLTLIEQADVPAREAGVVSDVSVREGATVKVGDLLAQLDDTDVKLVLERARIELETAVVQAENRIKIEFVEKSLQLADAELKRGIDTLERFKKSISDAEIDRLQLAAEKADLAVKQEKHEFDLAQFNRRIAQNELQLAERAVERRRITAPIEGVVVGIDKHKGEWVEPGEKFLRIVGLNRLRAEGFVEASRIRGELTGRPVMLTLDLPDQGQSQFRGTLTFVSPEINPVDGRVHVWAEIDNEQLRLGPGMRGAMTIEMVGQ